MSKDMKSWQSAWDIPAHVYNKYRQSCYPKEQRTCKRFRIRGQHILHGKYVLMLVVALCILDCCLVITELILDIHAVKDAIDTQHLADTLAHDDDYHQSADNTTSANLTNEMPPNYHVTERGPTAAHNVHRRAASAGGHDIPLTMKIAHACHYASVAILGVLLVYVLLKVLFFGKELFAKKLEMFDAFVVLASFALDLAFLDGLTNGPIENTAFILSFFVPWRVLRVVNSLVVAILDHEHYKLVLIYKSKKRVEQTLDDVREELHEALNRIKKIKDVALQNGVDEWKLNLSLVEAQKHDGKKNALSSFASFTFGAMAVKKGTDKFNEKRLSHRQQPEKTASQNNNEEKVDGVVRKEKVIQTKYINGTILENTEADSPKSISGDSALSLTLDAEQNDIAPGNGNESDDLGAEDTGCNTENDHDAENSENAGQSVISANGKISSSNVDKNIDSIGNTETGEHVTVVNIPENLDKDIETKPDHSAIQITFSESNLESRNLANVCENLGHDNTAFEGDDLHTKL